MIREFTQEDWNLYAGAADWSDPRFNQPWGSFDGSSPLICELGEWTFVLSAVGTEVHLVEERDGSTITVYGALNSQTNDMLSFPTQRFAYSWLVAVTFIFSMYGKFDPAEYGMTEIGAI